MNDLKQGSLRDNFIFSQKQKVEENKGKGYVYALQAFFAWGLLPLYWKQLSHLPAIDILAHRIIWSVVFSAIFLYFQKNFNLMPILRSPYRMKRLVIASLLVGSNWGLFIYAVNLGHIVEASLGYYINPLVNVALGIIVLKERLKTLQLIALVLAASAVVYLTVDYGQFPWIAIYLAFSFGFYGLMKKTSQVEAMPALVVETLVLSPLALIYVAWGLINGSSPLYNANIETLSLLVLTGVITTMPLYWFALGARLISLSAIGFMQYIGPSLMLMIGLFVYHEPFANQQFIAFSMIWGALILYSISIILMVRKRRIEMKN